LFGTVRFCSPPHVSLHTFSHLVGLRALRILYHTRVTPRFTRLTIAILVTSFLHTTALRLPRSQVNAHCYRGSVRRSDTVGSSFTARLLPGSYCRRSILRLKRVTVTLSGYWLHFHTLRVRWVTVAIRTAPSACLPRQHRLTCPSWILLHAARLPSSHIPYFLPLAHQPHRCTSLILRTLPGSRATDTHLLHAPGLHCRAHSCTAVLAAVHLRSFATTIYTPYTAYLGCTCRAFFPLFGCRRVLTTLYIQVWLLRVTVRYATHAHYACAPLVRATPFTARHCTRTLVWFTRAHRVWLPSAAHTSPISLTLPLHFLRTAPARGLVTRITVTVAHALPHFPDSAIIRVRLPHYTVHYSDLFTHLRFTARLRFRSGPGFTHVYSDSLPAGWFTAPLRARLRVTHALRSLRLFVTHSTPPL